MAKLLFFLSISASILLCSLVDLHAEGTPARLNYKEIYSEFEYPRAALDNEIDGIAFVEVSIDEYGFAYIVNVKRSDLFCYQKPIIAAVMKAKHTPASENGKAIKSIFIDTLYFPYPEDSKSSQEDRRSRYFKLHPNDHKLQRDSKKIPKSDTVISIDIEPEFDYVKLSKKVKYPQSMQEKKIEGRVLMRLFIDSKGVIKKSYPVESPHPALSLAAEEAILSIKFKPAKSNGKPVAIWLEIPIEFHLTK